MVKAYVDGSFNVATFEYAYGVVIFYNDKQYNFSGKGEDEDMGTMRNVAGEILASKFAMNWCIKHKVKKLEMYYDYEGIAKWCTGEWKTNKIWTKEYKQFYDEVSKKLEIVFIKVKSHSKDTYNDLADKLSKSEINLI